MSNATINFKTNHEDKECFELFCNQTGLTMTVCLNMFIKNVIAEQRLPFEVKADPFYSSEHIAMLEKRIEDIKSGRHTSPHELIEVD